MVETQGKVRCQEKISFNFYREIDLILIDVIIRISSSMKYEMFN
jgi:hypothetical protein